MNRVLPKAKRFDAAHSMTVNGPADSRSEGPLVSCRMRGEVCDQTEKLSVLIGDLPPTRAWKHRHESALLSLLNVVQSWLAHRLAICLRDARASL